jgi:cytochrome c-type biogenesis protein CcmH/NrfG
MAKPAQLPTDVNGDPSWFDRLSTAAGAFVSRAWFFSACVALVVIWAPSYFLFGDFDSYQLAINTPTTIVTFLLVALLQNTQRRADAAVQRKLNALALGLRDVLGAVSDPQIAPGPDTRAQLDAAVGLESRESS